MRTGDVIAILRSMRSGVEALRTTASDDEEDAYFAGRLDALEDAITEIQRGMLEP